jgi:hypothetical protein
VLFSLNLKTIFLKIKIKKKNSYKIKKILNEDFFKKKIIMKLLLKIIKHFKSIAFCSKKINKNKIRVLYCVDSIIIRLLLICAIILLF